MKEIFSYLELVLSKKWWLGFYPSKILKRLSRKINNQITIKKVAILVFDSTFKHRWSPLFFAFLHQKRMGADCRHNKYHLQCNTFILVPCSVFVLNVRNLFFFESTRNNFHFRKVSNISVCFFCNIVSSGDCSAAWARTKLKGCRSLFQFRWRRKVTDAHYLLVGLLCEV